MSQNPIACGFFGDRRNGVLLKIRPEAFCVGREWSHLFFLLFFILKLLAPRFKHYIFSPLILIFKSVSILSLNFFASKILISQTLRFDKNHSYTLSPIYWYVLARLHLAPQPGCIATARLPPPAPPAKPPSILSNRRSRSVALAPTDIHTSFSFTKFHIGGCDTSLSRRDQGGLCFLRYCLVVVPTGESTTLVKESEELYVSPLSFGRRCCTRPNYFSNIAPRSCTFKL